MHSSQAADDFFNSDPSRTWRTAFDKLEAVTVKNYGELLIENVKIDYWTSGQFFYEDFVEIGKGEKERRAAFLRIGGNATALVHQLQMAFNKKPIEGAVAAETPTSVVYAVKLYQFIIRLLGGLAHLHSRLYSAILPTVLQVQRDVLTIGEINEFKAKAAAGKAL